jgi:hypothetical protein
MSTQDSQSSPSGTLPAANHLPPCGQPSVRKNDPPISKKNPRRSSAGSTAPSSLVFPSIIYRRNHFVRPNKSPAEYVSLDLRTPRLNAIHQHLWLAGLPNAARPLHRQKLLGRTILVTEDPDEHLVWFEAQIFVKPLPEYLLDHDCWDKYLCANEDLYQSACGLVLSYTWLVCHKSDLAIAQEIGLLSKDIAWPDWVEFLDTFLDNINLVTLSEVSKRYRYGELRLSRLNTIYRLMPPAHSLRNLVRGYRAGSTWYNAFFGRHFKWMLAAFAVLSVLLSALQVGLATSVLQNNRDFQRASYGFTIAALAAVAASAVGIFFVWMVMFWYYLLSSWWYDRKIGQERSATITLP